MARWFTAVLAALLCLGLSLSAGWLWQTMSDLKYEASARLLCLHHQPAANAESNDADAEEIEELAEAEILTPDVLSAAATLLRERSVPLSLLSPFDPVADYLVQHTRVSCPEQGQPGEICIRCTAKSSTEAVQLVQAIVDAYVATRRNEPLENSELSNDDSKTELQQEHAQLAEAVERQKQAIEELEQACDAGQPAASDSAAGNPTEVESALRRVRKARRGAISRLVKARRDFENKLPAETIAARITDVPARSQVLEQLSYTKNRDELQRLEARRRNWETVYGRNHPRMVEVREIIAKLKEQLADSNLEHPGQTEILADASPEAIVLTALETESEKLLTVVQQLIVQLDEIQERQKSQQELEEKLGDARQELEFLNLEYDRTRSELTALRNEDVNLQQTVLAAPTLDRQPLRHRAGLPLAVSCATGMTLYLLILWQIRRKWLCSERVKSRDERQSESLRGERFHSQEEERLMRLRLAGQG
jgi:hypothetical protein